MEFLKSCNTNAQAIGDFEAVAFQAFSVRRNAAPSSKLVDRGSLEDLRAAEADLRQSQHLVVQDVSRLWIWFFRACTVDKVGQKPEDLPTIDGYIFQREQYGVMKASELARPMSMRPLNPPSASASTPSTPIATKGPLGSGGRPSDQPQPHDSCAIYELFTSSVVALLMYHLVKDQDAIALNYRTFISKPADSNDSDKSKANPVTPLFWMVSINVFWASSGSLIISLFSLLKSDIHCLEQVTSIEEQKLLLGRCIRVSPNGSLARIVSFEDPLDTALEDTNQRMQRKRLKTGSAEQNIEKWKSSVKRWLALRGYAITNLESATSWVKIRVGQSKSAAVSSPAFSSQSREILWPRALCFFYDDPGGEAASLFRFGGSQKERLLEWFETEQSPGFRDPVEVAQQWFLGKPGRDKLIDGRRKAKKAEEEAARPKEELPGGLFPSSPLNSRTGVYGELQAVSGVYPTPPDGLLPGTGISSGDTPGISGTTANTLLPPGGNNPAINLLGPLDNVSIEEQHRLATSPQFPTSFDQFNTTNGNDDDLFEDMDGDNFEGSGVTDADFNFFDEPDGDDVDMLDAPAIQEGKPTPSKKAPREKPVQHVPVTTNRDESADVSDPMAALEDALAVASDPVDTKPTPQSLEPMKTVPSNPSASDSQGQSEFFRSLPISPPRKAPTPPLSPQDIHERLLPSPMKKKTPSQNMKELDNGHVGESVFDPFVFSQKMKLSDAKYIDGRFISSQAKLVIPEDDEKIAPKQPASLRNIPLLTKLRYAIGVASSKAIPEIASLARADDDFSDTSSDKSSILDDDLDLVEDLQSLPPEPLSAALIATGKRKLPTDGNATPISTTSFADSFGGDFLDVFGLQTDESSLAALEPDPWDWSLISVPGPIECHSNNGRYNIPLFSQDSVSMPNTPTSQPDLTDIPDEKPLSSKDSIAIAQIVTDQITFATLDILHETDEGGPVDTGDVTGLFTSLTLRGAVRHLFPKATECSVSNLASIHDVFPDPSTQAKSQQRPPARKPNEPAPVPGHHVYQINTPYMRVRRGDTLWDMLPPALAFWEVLGLAPSSPAKNVVSFCVYPHSESIIPCLENFMLNMQVAYESCKLGNHVKGDTVPEYGRGLVPCKIGSSKTSRAVYKALRDTCISLGKLLSMKHAQMNVKDDQKTNAFVIYMIDPFNDPSAIWELCSSFWALFQSYGQGPTNRPDYVAKPDLVLQIVPIKYIASLDVPITLATSTYASLAREVYDRCPPSAPSEDKTPLSIYSAPSFQLEEAIPRRIPFIFSVETPQDLLRENSYIHIGYAISLDGSWVTAAWTDGCGKSQAVISYNLGTRAFGEIAKEIWQTTFEILQARRVMWRVCIAKAGVMEREEIEAWVFLASCPPQPNFLTTLLAVDTNPPFAFTPSITSPPSQSTSAANASANTPGSTPQAGISPDPHSLTPAATPSAEPATDPTTDPEARLIDTTDESWGVILSHRLHNTHSTVEFRPCVISGLLVKRGLSTPPPLPQPDPSPSSPPTSFDPSLASTPGPIIIGVNIVWICAVNPIRSAASTPSAFPSANDGVSPGTPGGGVTPSSASTTNPSLQDRGSMNIMWTPNMQTRVTAENLLKEVLAQYRGLGTLARLKGVRGTRGGTVPWHIAVAKRGVEGLGRV
ncbi:mediator complex subunit 13 C-terminal-domain-containing protein, partial [Dendryphion nanum]